MKVFISWSGEFSRKVAERLSIWIPTIIQSVDVFYSPDDIAKGENWGNRLSDELEQCNFGIVCLTPENVTAPWIHFEAGALSKAANSRVSAIMFGISPSDIKGPLARLQNTAFNRDDFFRLLQSINNSSDSPLKSEILKNAFDNSWERLMGGIDAIINAYTSRAPSPSEESGEHKKRDSDSNAIQEILRIVRSLDNSRKSLVSVSASASSPSPNDLSRYSGHAHLIGFEDHINKALSISINRKPLRSCVSDMKYIGNNIYKCTIEVPVEQWPAFKEELTKSVPKVLITA